MNLNVLFAVFRRNFISYFTNATGYVFICVFVLLSSFAAFWPNDFFNANLANLDQLNKWFPYIMLIFIPAITMSTWAEERREGTDELLLTIPARDIDLVLGKYFAAVAIVTVSLLFSMATNWIVLGTLGEPDWGQMTATYVGYWLVGLAMLAIGQVASFLTKNLTVAYILGAVFNAPLVFAPLAGSFLPSGVASRIAFWGIGSRFADFGNGVISLGGIAYFLVVTIVMLYFCVVLVGYRRWTRKVMVLHYALRMLSLAVIGVCFCVIFQLNDVRWDWTVGRLSSLSAKSKELLTDLKKDRVVQIEAFVSPEVPETYVQTRLNLLNTLREIEAVGGGQVRVKINETEKLTEEAARAEQRYGIMPRQVTFLDRGAIKADRIFLGVAIRSGLNRVTIPFVDRGIPIEYELIRSVCTVLEESRKKIGVLATDAQLYGQFNMQTMSPGQGWPIIDELEKQYDLVQVDASKPIEPGTIDALLAVQPSSLAPEAMQNFVAAVKQGLPTVIFEDPAPLMSGAVPATSEPRRPPGGGMSMFMQQEAPLKGEISELWEMLGIEFPANQIIWQDFNPYPKVSQFGQLKEYVFIDPSRQVHAMLVPKVESKAKGKEESQKEAGDKEVQERVVVTEEAGTNGSFSAENPISSGLQQVLLPFPGSFRKLNVSVLDVEPLVSTGTKTGTIQFRDITSSRAIENLRRFRASTGDEYMLAAHITGTLPEEKAEKTGEDAEDTGEAKPDEAKPEKSAASKINIVLVADVDMISPGFFDLRAQGASPEAGFNFNFDNVTFALNALDAVAGDDRFIEIRKRRQYHPILTKIDEDTEQARQETTKAREQLQKEFDEELAKSDQEFDKQLRELQEKTQSGGMDAQAAITQIAIMQRDRQKRQQAVQESLQRKLERQVNQIDTDLEVKVRSVQNWYKRCAVLLPPILPLILAMIVFFIRRVQERQGAVRGRMRK